MSGRTARASRAPGAAAAAAWRRRHGALFRRPGLSRRVRHGAALSALVGTGDWAGYEAQAAWAREDRVPLAWLREVVLQSYLFAGYPRAITALRILGGAENPAGAGRKNRFLRDGAPPSTWRPRGLDLCARIYGERFPALRRAMGAIHPDLADWMINEGYGKVLARPFLGAKIRELCVVPLLAAQESWPQLRSHLEGALRVGARPREVAEALEIGLRMAPACDRGTAIAVWRRTRCAVPQV